MNNFTLADMIKFFKEDMKDADWKIVVEKVEDGN
tara:strand:+ start:109 stop:210 length:102 start_codon:yes stop_codon:yes gene_type:complete